MLNNKKFGEHWRAPTAGSNCSQVTTTDSCPTKQGAQGQEEWWKSWTFTFYNATGCGLLCLNCNPENVPNVIFVVASTEGSSTQVILKKLWASATFYLLCLTRLHKTHVSQGKYIQYIQELVGEPWKMEGTIPPKSVASTWSRNWASAECWTRKGRNPPYSNGNDGCKCRWLPWRHRKHPVFVWLTSKSPQGQNTTLWE